MKRHCATLTLTLLLAGLTPMHSLHAAGGGANKGKNAKETMDPRYKGLKGVDLKLLRKVDEEYPRLMQQWVEIRDAYDLRSDAQTTWGTRARRDADRIVETIDRNMPRDKERFDSELEKAQRDVSRPLEKLKDRIDSMEKRRPSPNEQMQARRMEELAELRKEENELMALRGLFLEMEEFFSDYSRAHNTLDRLAQVGISRHDSSIRNYQDEFEDLIEDLYNIKDHIADVEALEALKAEGTEAWTPRHDTMLTQATMAMERAGSQLEKTSAGYIDNAKRQADRLTPKIESLQKRVDGAREGSSSRDRYMEQKWELEAELATHQSVISTAERLANWKSMRKKPSPEKKPAQKPKH
jgi:hypothetical protein